MNHYANPQSVDQQTIVAVLACRAAYLKLEEATQDDLDEKELLRKWQKNRPEKEGEQKRETGKDQPGPKPRPKS